MNIKTYLILISCFMLISSCQKLYWQRNKVKTGDTPRRTFQVNVINHSPHYLPGPVEAGIKKSCESEIRKAGHRISRKDTPNYIVHITLYVDSFKSARVYELDYSQPDLMRQRDRVKAIIFNYSFIHKRTGTATWFYQNDIFFQKRPRRNLKRSMNMVRFTIKRALQNIHL